MKKIYPPVKSEAKIKFKYRPYTDKILITKKMSLKPLLLWPMSMNRERKIETSKFGRRRLLQREEIHPESSTHIS